MRVLLVVSTLRPVTGWGTYGLNTVRGLRNRGHTVQALVHETGEENNKYAVLPEPHHLLGSPLLWLRTAWAIRRAIQQFQPDIVHILVEPYALVMPFVSMMTRKMPPWVLSLNGTYSVTPLYDIRTRRIFCAAYRKASKILIPSAYTGKRAQAAVHERCGKACATHILSKMVHFRLGIENVDRTSRNTDEHRKHILYVGGIKPRKGIAEIVSACAEFRKISRIPFHLHLVGTLPNDRYARNVQHQVASLGLQSQVTFHGHIDHETLEKLYNRSDLFIMLSKSHGHHFEGFGLVFLEANIRGIPTIGPMGSGCVEAINDGISGFIVNPDDPMEVAKNMQRILEENKIDPEQCRRWALQHSIDQQVATFERIYEETLQSRLR